MPKLWLNDGGGAATSPKDRALEISFTDFSTAFGEKRIQPFHGDRSGFNLNDPSGPQHVLLEVGGNELKPPLFSHPGYYLIEGLSPNSAREALRKAGVNV